MRRLRVRRVALLFTPYALVIAIGFGGFRQLEHDRHVDCLRANSTRLVLREVVEEATKGGTALDLRQVPGFDDLDPTTKEFVANIAAVSIAAKPDPAQSSLHDRLLKFIPPDDHC